MNSKINPIQRESLIRALSTADIDSLHAIKNEIELNNSETKVIHVNGFIDMLKVNSIEMEHRANGEEYINNPKNKFIMSPELERLFYCVGKDENLSKEDKEQLFKYDNRGRKRF